MMYKGWKMVISYNTLPEQVLRIHARTSDNYKWVWENWNEILEQFSGQFIAIAECRIVYNTVDHMDFLNYLSEHREQPDIIGIRVRPHDQVLIL